MNERIFPRSVTAVTKLNGRFSCVTGNVCRKFGVAYISACYTTASDNPTFIFHPQSSSTDYSSNMNSSTEPTSSITCRIVIRVMLPLRYDENHFPSSIQFNYSCFDINGDIPS